MSRRWMCVLMLVCAPVLVMPRAWAQRPPDTDPPAGVIIRDINMGWDRSAMPGDIEILAPKTLIAYDIDLSKQYGKLYLTCESASDPTSGMCRTEDTEAESGDVTSVIPVRAIEERTGSPSTINFAASIYRADSTQICSLDYFRDTRYAIWSSHSRPCGSDYAVGTGLTIAIAGDSIARLVAGRWRGSLELNLRMPPGRHLAKYIVNFDFTVTDYDAISIYFPGFDGIAPLVNMDLRYDPIRKMVGGYKEVDMCLYDGVGSQSEFLGVTVRDSGPRPPPGRDFAVWHGDGGSDDTQRLDYQVGLKYGGNLLAMKHGEEQLLRGIDSAQLRLVMLPGINQPVYCVPTPLVLETPPTPIASKRPGLYDGELTVELRVPTAKP
ncbi:pilin protein [Stenotrophomonas maltophilia]|uniref:CfaE/CblD family pilus tip adhesin n=1 Tax=Stenotrophomonas TaxID=40323 RepID=UPI0018D333A6|nr:CfaE/CblD family pilus tip adhesin [Stenotrophomonas sp. 9]MBH1738068.1 pilin protein [Stenotrophomonas maltophilia]WNB81056.1 CfaE/CblD family pilus tip adhesin [Stenotrophomonas sp. 9]